MIWEIYIYDGQISTATNQTSRHWTATECGTGKTRTARHQTAKATTGDSSDATGCQTGKSEWVAPADQGALMQSGLNITEMNEAEFRDLCFERARQALQPFIDDKLPMTPERAQQMVDTLNLVYKQLRFECLGYNRTEAEELARYG